MGIGLPVTFYERIYCPICSHDWRDVSTLVMHLDRSHQTYPTLEMNRLLPIPVKNIDHNLYSNLIISFIIDRPIVPMVNVWLLENDITCDFVSKLIGILSQENEENDGC